MYAQGKLSFILLKVRLSTTGYTTIATQYLTDIFASNKPTNVIIYNSLLGIALRFSAFNKLAMCYNTARYSVSHRDFSLLQLTSVDITLHYSISY